MKKHEGGQSLVIIALMFLGLVAIAALVVDGGSLYLNRRSAQTAADAAAMAGARALCIDKLTNIDAVVTKYAKTENGATDVTIPPTIVTTKDATTGALKSVSVHTTVSTTSFIANVLGFKTDTVTADAKAGCFIPSTGKNLLPIAWTCQPTVGSTDTSKCQINSIPWDVFQKLQTMVTFSGNSAVILDAGTSPNDKTPGDYIDGSADGFGSKMAYLVMDSSKFDAATVCKELNPTGTLTCDLSTPPDGVLDVDGGADRGWLTIGDKSSASALSDLIQNGNPTPLTLPQWFPGSTGDETSVFKTVNNYAANNLSFVPVFNAVCPGSPDTTAICASEYNGEPINNKNGTATYYRVASFAPFVVTCVDDGGGGAKCPAREAALAGAKKSDWSSVKSIEGYFVSGLSASSSIDPTSFDLGVYVISLMK